MAAKKKVPQVSKVPQVPRARTTRATRTPRGTATTMEEVLARNGHQIKSLSRGQEVVGRVIEVTGKNLVLDVGAKAEGLVVDREFEAARDFIKSLKPGDEVRAQVIVAEAEGGQSLLSLRQTALEQAWSHLKAAKEKNRDVEVRVDNVARGGLGVAFEGISGFIPASHLGGEISKLGQGAQGSTTKARVIELDREQGRLVLSEKAVSEAPALAAQKKALAKIKKGEKFRGRVVGLTNFGAFVQVEKDGVSLDGLVHLSEIAWEKVSTPSSVLKEGQEVEVLVLGKEESEVPGGGRLALSIKKAGEDPWESAAGKFKPDTTVKGKVTKMGEFGALVELAAGIEGLLHISKIPAGVSVSEGDEIDVFVEEVDPEARRISLGMVLKEKPIGYK